MDLNWRAEWFDYSILLAERVCWAIFGFPNHGRSENDACIPSVMLSFTLFTFRKFGTNANQSQTKQLWIPALFLLDIPHRFFTIYQNSSDLITFQTIYHAFHLFCNLFLRVKIFCRYYFSNQWPYFAFISAHVFHYQHLEKFLFVMTDNGLLHVKEWGICSRDFIIYVDICQIHKSLTFLVAKVF